MKRSWMIPALIVAVNATAVLLRWSSLPAMVPAHFDLQGNAAGSMPRGTLLFFLLAGAVFCLLSYVAARLINNRAKNQKKADMQLLGVTILASGLTLVLFASSLVTLTTGTVPFFMLAEPFILGLALAGFIYCLIKARNI